MMSWSGGWPWTAQAMSGPLRATGEGQQGRAVTFVTQLQDALLRCSQWPVELAAEGSPGQPLCLAPVWPGSCVAGTSGSYTNASNQTLSQLMLMSAASATQSIGQLPSSTCLASFSFVATGQLDAQPHQATPASALACPSEALSKQCTNPIFAPGAVERHVSTAIVPTPATSMSNSQPAKMSTYLSEVLTRAATSTLATLATLATSLHSSTSTSQRQAPADKPKGGAEGQVGQQGLLGLMAHHAAHQMATAAPWQPESGDMTQASDWQKLESEVRTRRNTGQYARILDRRMLFTLVVLDSISPT
ncbi:hypothetical protein HaLaN_07337, partial [Haematococcus lacustris]